MKEMVYYQNSTSLAELQRLTSQEWATISVETLQKVCDNFVLRFQHVIVMNGGQLIILLYNFQILLMNAVAAAP